MPKAGHREKRKAGGRTQHKKQSRAKNVKRLSNLRNAYKRRDPNRVHMEAVKREVLRW